MQRADAASSSSRNPASAPPSKRRRVDFDSHPSTLVPAFKGPAGPSATPASTSVQSQSQSRIGRDGDETEWALNIAPPPSKTKPQTNGYHQQGDEDEEDEDSLWSSQSAGRQTFGSFKKKKKKAQTQASVPATNDDDLTSVSGSDVESKSLNPTRTPTQPRAANSQSNSRSSQQPKRFFDQISTTDPTDPRSPAIDQRRKKSKPNKKPRITI